MLRIAASLLIAVDLPHPSTLGDVGLRVLFTLVGSGIAVAAMLLANLIQKPTARTVPQP